MSESRASRGVPGVGTAVPLTVADRGFGSTNRRGIGSESVAASAKSRFGLVTGSERLMTGASRPAPANVRRSLVGSLMASKMANPGILTWVIPAPSGPRNEAFLGVRVASIVISKWRVRPGTTVTGTGVLKTGRRRVTEPASVVREIRLMVGRSGTSASGVMLIDFRSMLCVKVIDTDCPTEPLAAVATQAVLGSPSMAAAGPSDGSLNRGDDPYDVADTEVAPIGSDTVSEPRLETTEKLSGVVEARPVGR